MTKEIAKEAKETTGIVEPFKSGLTWRSFLALLYASIVLMPAALFSDLVTGIGIAAVGMPVIGFVAVYLAAEIARLAGASLTKQELFIIWSHSLIATGGTIAMTFIHALYFRSISPVSWAFFKEGKPLPLVIPDWYAPPPTSNVLRLRTLFHPDFVVPVALYTSIAFLTWRALYAIKGFINYQIFAVGEKLPFPISQVQAETCLTLADREPRKYDLLMVTAFLAAFYAFVTYFLPYGLGLPQIVPIPWVDLNSSIERSLPGASFGIGTDIISLAVGMMLPFNVVLSMLIGSVAVWLIGNPLLVRYGQIEYRPGMDIAFIYQRSTLQFWAFPHIGLFVAAAIIPLLLKPKAFAVALKSISKITGETKQFGMVSIRILLLLFFAVSGVLFGLAVWLTRFPWYYLALLIFGWSFIAPMIATRSYGETGLSISVPYVTQTTILLSGYQGADIWFSPVDLGSAGGADIAGWFKVCELTRTTISSWLKAWVIITPIAWALSFLYVELFWKIAPIPSATYPATNIVWPVNVINQALWITGAVGLTGSQMLILYSFIIGSAIALANQFLHIPVSLISLAVGASSAIPPVITMTLGGVISRIIVWKWGSAAWNRDRTTIVAGIFLGQSIVLTLAVGGTMLVKSLWPLPF